MDWTISNGLQVRVLRGLSRLKGLAPVDTVAPSKTEALDLISQEDAERAIDKANPTVTPTAGQPVEINGKSYILKIESHKSSGPVAADCNEITIWPDKKNEADKVRPSTKPAYKSLVCG